MYRSELEAARARIASLEQEVSELRGSARSNSRDQYFDVIAVWGPLGLAAALEFLAFVLAVVGQDATAEWVAARVVLLGLATPAWSWGRARRLFGMLGFIALKALSAELLPRLVQAFKALISCGSITQPEQCLGVFDLSYYAFWYAPLAVVLVLVLEALTLRVLLRQRH